MRKKPHGRIIRAQSAVPFPVMNFKSFDHRPVNYHKGMLSNQAPSAPSNTTPADATAEIRLAVSREESRLRKEHEQNLRTRLHAAVESTRQESEGEFKKAIDLLRQYANLLQSEKAELAARYEKEVLLLAFELAERILGRELKERPESIAQIANSALQQVIDCSRITVRANPQDLTYLKNLRADIETQLSQETKLELISDASVEQGGCMIDTEKGSLDARISSQLETMKTNLDTSSKNS